MQKNQLIFLVILVIHTTWISAQQLTPAVISTSGGFYSNDAGMLSFTTGEMVSVETYISPSAILTQGFQQPWDLGTTVVEHPIDPFSFGLYPNPTYGNFNLVTESEDSHLLYVRVLDLMGREIMRNEFYHQASTHVHPIDLSFASQGMYLIYMHVEGNVFVRKLQVIK